MTALAAAALSLLSALHAGAHSPKLTPASTHTHTPPPAHTSQVFASEAELRQHTAREHGETLSKAEKRQALTLPVSFSYRRGPEAADGTSSSAAAAAHPLAAAVSGGRGAVVIGGAASLPGCFGQRGRAGSRGGLAEPSATARAVEASLDSAAVEQAVRESTGQQQQQQQQQQAPALRDSDFPAALGSAAAPAAIGGWAGAAGAGPAGTLRPEDFPALPGSSKSAKRRAAAKKKSMAAALGGGGSVRVVHTAAPPSDGEAFPALGAAAAGGSGGAVQGDSGAGGSRPSSAGSNIADAEGYRQLQRDNWDSVLPRGRCAAPRQPQPSKERAGAVTGHGLPRPPSAQEIRGPQPEPLSPTAAAAAGAGFAGGAARRGAAKQLPPRDPAGSSAAAAVDAGAAAMAPASAPGSISEALREANRALVAKIKARLSPADFGMFRHRSGAWLRSELSSTEYHDAITGLGEGGPGRH